MQDVHALMLLQVIVPVRELQIVNRPVWSIGPVHIVQTTAVVERLAAPVARSPERIEAVTNLANINQGYPSTVRSRC